VFPFTFMISMGWGCDSSTRALGSRALSFYDAEPGGAQAAIADAKQQREAGRTRRQILRATLLFLSVAIPITFISVVVEEHQTIGITPLTALAALLALSLVIATTVIATRR
jgi:Na+/melibiose symporter-like transporter